MASAARQGATVALVAVALATSMLHAPAPALAVKSTLEQRRAQERAIRVELEAAKQELAVKVADYVEISQQLDRIRQQIAVVEGEITAADERLAKAEDAVTRRAVQLYRGGRVGMFEVLFSSDTVGQLMDRAYYLVLLGAHDSDLIAETRLARTESLWLQESLDLRAERLQRIQEDADAQRIAIEKRVAEQEKQARKIGADISRLVAVQRQAAKATGGEPTGQFNTDTVISESNYRDWQSMTVDDIQKFLDAQPGTLKSYKARDHNGRLVTTAQMIAEASQAWRISPRVILVKLQKEQSLLADKSPSKTQYEWAMGCGARDSGKDYKYAGFGKQIWCGAMKLHQNAAPWRPGISMKIDGSRIHPTNSATYSLYKYTPHFRGTMSFWMLYWRYFGDPLSVPQPAVL